MIHIAKGFHSYQTPPGTKIIVEVNESVCIEHTCANSIGRDWVTPIIQFYVDIIKMESNKIIVDCDFVMSSVVDQMMQKNIRNLSIFLNAHMDAIAYYDFFDQTDQVALYKEVTDGLKSFYACTKLTYYFVFIPYTLKSVFLENIVVPNNVKVIFLRYKGN